MHFEAVIRRQGFEHSAKKRSAVLPLTSINLTHCFSFLSLLPPPLVRSTRLAIQSPKHPMLNDESLIDKQRVGSEYSYIKLQL